MAQAGRSPRLVDWCWLLFCLVASSAWCVSAASQLSATFDEPLYLSKGLERWRTGSHSGLIRLGTMPLPIDVETLPVFVWERSRGKPFDLVSDFETILPIARLGNLAFWWVLLVYGWLAARDLAGPWAGRLAVALLASEPSLLGHAGLATTDIAISACLLAFCYHFRRGRGDGWRWRVGLPGCLFGVALLAKASALVFGPLCMVIIEIDRWAHEGALSRLLTDDERPSSFVRRLAHFVRRLLALSHSARRDMLQIMAVGFVVMMLYSGCDWRPEPSFVAWAQKLPQGAAHDVMLWIAEHLRIFSNGAEGIVRQIKHNMKGHHGAYLLGEAHPKSVWYYFPLALSMKLSLPLLLTSFAALAARRARALNWAFQAAIALLLFSVTCRVQIGIRFMLPLIVFLLLGVAAAVAQSVANANAAWRGRMAAAAATAIAAWAVAIALSVWPHGLCYINELWGGADRGYLCLSDSNYDWGQGLKELKRWQQEQDLSHLDVWYFGADPTVGVEPLRSLPLHVLPLTRPQEVPAYVQGNYVAVGATLLYGTTTLQAPHRNAVEYFRSREPVARTTTFLIFDVGADKAAVAASGGPIELQASRWGSRP